MEYYIHVVIHTGVNGLSLLNLYNYNQRGTLVGISLEVYYEQMNTNTYRIQTKYACVTNYSNLIAIVIMKLCMQKTFSIYIEDKIIFQI